jgi:hypothetical protein
MENSSMKQTKKPRRVVSIPAGNLIQLTWMVLGGCLLYISTQPSGPRTIAMIVGYLMIYFSTHSSSHYVVGRLVGIKFTHYSLGGSSHASNFPPVMRQIFEHLPFFAAHADPMSLKAASPTARALMFAAGLVGTVVFSTLATLCAYYARVPGATIFLIFNIFWQIGTIITETRPGGDLAKARKALRP